MSPKYDVGCPAENPAGAQSGVEGAPVILDYRSN